MSLMWKGDENITIKAGARLPAPRGSGPLYGVVDTTFATVNMGDIAVKRLQELGVPPERIVRTTVPGFKDLAVEAKRLIERRACAIVLACGMVGPEEIDKLCGHEASLGIMQARLLTTTHILEAFVHMDEVRSDAALIRLCENRVSEHADNMVFLAERPQELVARAGTGQRQGFQDVGPADPTRDGAGHLKPASGSA